MAVMQTDVAHPRILVIEDNYPFAELVCELAKKVIPDIECIHTPLLKDAINILQARPVGYFNALIVDLNLPDTGWDNLLALHALYGINHGANVIVLTGGEDRSEEARLYGARTYLLKQQASNESIQRILMEAVGRGA